MRTYSKWVLTLGNTGDAYDFFDSPEEAHDAIRKQPHRYTKYDNRINPPFMIWITEYDDPAEIVV